MWLINMLLDYGIECKIVKEQRRMGEMRINVEQNDQKKPHVRKLG